MGKDNLPEKSWALTGIAFSRFLHWLAPDERRAGEMYERLRQKLCMFFEHRGCQSAEELTDKTLDRIARKLESGEEIKVSDPMSYCYGVAHNILKEFWRDPYRNTISLDSQPTESNSFPNMTVSHAALDEQKEIELHLDRLKSCLQQLSSSERELIVKYYEGDHRERITNRHELASRLGIPPGTLRIRALRIRERLLSSMKG